MRLFLDFLTGGVENKNLSLEQLAQVISALIVAGVTVGAVVSKILHRYVKDIVVDVLDKRLADIYQLLKEQNATLQSTNERLAHLEASASGPGLKVRGTDANPQRQRRWTDRL